MHQFLTPAGEYLCAAQPRSLSGRPVEAVLSELAAQQPTATVLFWDGQTEAGERVTWGTAGLDPLLAADRDLTGCAAISRAAMQRMVDRGGATSLEDLPRALGLLCRSPGLQSRWSDELVGDLDNLGIGALAKGAGPGGSAERLSIVLLLDPALPSPQPFLDALSAQVFSGAPELIVASRGLNAADRRAAIKTTEDWAQASGKIRVRRYAVGAEVPQAYFINALVALAFGDAVVFVSPPIVPREVDTIQRVADWAAGADVAAATPGLEFEGVLIAAGLSLMGGGPLVRQMAVGRQGAFNDVTRLAAAPTPWFFAANRTAWLNSGGMRGGASDELWTAGFAAAGGPSGRTLYVGGERASWRHGEPPVGWSMTTEVQAPFAPSGLLAMGVSDPAATDVARPPSPAAAAAPERALGPTVFAIDDPTVARPQLRLLILADANGPSQAILFDQALADARRAGRVGCFLLSEDALLAGAFDDGQVVEAVEAAFNAARPDLLVVSRLGHGAIWRAAHALANARGVPIVCHLDDDLLDLPVTVGIERYRKGRAPRRIATLQSCLEVSDLVLATTPLLARKLASYVSHGRVHGLDCAIGGAPPLQRPARASTGVVRIGYMGSASHNADLAMIAPALAAVARALPDVEIELFGSIARQPAAALLPPGARHPGVNGDYAGFKARLAELNWDIGLAPLRSTPFNRLKTPTKWAEYAEAGIAVAVSNVDPYQVIAGRGGALAVSEAGWEGALLRLAADAALRHTLVMRADRILSSDYRWEILGEAVEGALKRLVVRQAVSMEMGSA